MFRSTFSLVTFLAIWFGTLGTSSRTTVLATANGAILTTTLDLSDNSVLVNDSVSYKLIIKNTTRSSVQLRNRNVQPRTEVVQYLECRSGKKEWHTVREISASKSGKIGGDLFIGAEETFALYGQFFLTETSEFDFPKAGEYEIRVRLACLLGEFVSNSQKITVRDRPASELPILDKSRKLVELFVAPNQESTLLEEKRRIQATLSSGAIKRSLDLRLKIADYRHTGKIAGEPLELMAAHKEVCKGLDKVRVDVATIDFMWIAHERKSWDELDRLIQNLREDSQIRRTFVHELENAAKIGIGPPIKP